MTATKKKKRKKNKVLSILWGVISGLITALMLIVLMIILDGRHTEVEMLGPERLELQYGEAFDDPGVVLRTVGRVFPETAEPQTVYAAVPFDPTQLGEQTLSYLYADMGVEKSLTRTITVVDTQKPVIELLPLPEGAEPGWLHGYAEPG